jgi:ZIP family zinc transporter
MSLVYYDRWMTGKRATPLVGPGAAAVDEFSSRSWIERLTPGRRLALLIATGIGLHNFGEGLAIGQAAASDEVSLALVLIIGFALHNATEGFGIVGPLGAIRPPWAWLGVAGLVGGAPTLLGTMLGFQFHSDALELCFYALAGGALLYVIGEIWIGTRRHGHRTLGLFLLAAGFLAGAATDLVVAYGGG